MSLSALIATQKSSISVGKKKLNLRALSLGDIAELSQQCPNEMKAIIEDDSPLGGLIRKSPEFAARIIAFAANEPEGWQDALKLPIGVQIQALNTIWDLSALTEDDLGKFLTRIFLMLIKGTEALPDGLTASGG